MGANSRPRRFGVGAAILLTGALASLAGCAHGGSEPESEPAVVHGMVVGAVCGRRPTPEQERAGACLRPQEAIVTAQSLDRDWSGQTLSDRYGRYSIVLIPGRYQLRVPTRGSLRAAVIDVTIGSGESREVWLRQATEVK